MSRSEKMEKKVALAVENLQAGYSCSECLLISYGPDLGLPSVLAFKLASGFGGGMGLLGGTCGVVTAAYMIIGLKAGADRVEDAFSRELTYETVAEFAGRFQALHGSTLCRELTGGRDITDPRCRAQIRKSGRVPQLVSDAVRILEGLFAEND